MEIRGENAKLKQFLLGNPSQQDAEEIGVQIILNNAFHVHLRPGAGAVHVRAHRLLLQRQCRRTVGDAAAVAGGRIGGC